MSIPLEICIDAAFATQAAKAAYEGGADRIELCSQMHLDGLTPSLEEIAQARKAFPKPGLMVMIRPKESFSYGVQELEHMLQSIEHAKNIGADGVVFGPLNGEQLDLEATRALTQHAQSLELLTTFHRAFDAIQYPEEALETLIELGVNHILTSGTVWGSKQGALDGMKVLQSLLKQAKGRIEIIVGGGVNHRNLPTILQALEPCQHFSIHTFSGAQQQGVTSVYAIRKLKEILYKT